MSILSKPYFHDEEAAIAHLESIVWADGITCPKCGTVDKSGKLQGKTARPGLRKCYACRKQFTVKVGILLGIQGKRLTYKGPSGPVAYTE